MKRNVIPIVLVVASTISLFERADAAACWYCLSQDDKTSASWFLVFIASPLDFFCGIVIALGLHDLFSGSGICSRPILFTVNALAALLQLSILAFASVLVAHGTMSMLVFVIFSALALICHVLIIGMYVRNGFRRMKQDHPRQQLLTSGGGERPVTGADVENPPNPFGAPTLGIIPGTSNTGYMLWLPSLSDSWNISSGHNHQQYQEKQQDWRSNSVIAQQQQCQSQGDWPGQGHRWAGEDRGDEHRNEDGAPHLVVFGIGGVKGDTAGRTRLVPSDHPASSSG